MVQSRIPLTSFFSITDALFVASAEHFEARKNKTNLDKEQDISLRVPFFSPASKITLY